MIALLSVLRGRQHLQVGLAMKTTDHPALQRNDVVDLVAYTGGLCQCVGCLVYGLHGYRVGPWRSGSELSRSATGGSSILRTCGAFAVVREMVPVLSRPFGVSSGDGRLVLFGIDLPQIPAPLRILLVMLFRRLDEFLAMGLIVGFPIRRLAIAIRCSPRMFRFAKPFDVLCSVCAALFADRRFVGVVPSLVGIRMGFPVSLLVVTFLGPSFLVGHFSVSMWRSTMRRTSSAIEIPKRFASRLSNWCCGTVNEMSCFTMGSMIPRYHCGVYGA
jgi:hypothetical protein